MHRMVFWQAPLHGPSLGAMDNNWQLDSLLPQPQDQLAHAANLGKLAEHQ